jgi:hypothetical protein
LHDVALRIDVSETAVSRYEEDSDLSPVIDLDLLRREFEAAGVLFANGPPPGARTQADIKALRARNHRLRVRIDQLLESADDSLRAIVRRIVLEQAPAVIDDEAETLERVHDNLCLRANALVRAGAAKPKHFEDLLHPPAASRTAANGEGRA